MSPSLVWRNKEKKLLKFIKKKIYKKNIKKIKMRVSLKLEILLLDLVLLMEYWLLFDLPQSCDPPGCDWRSMEKMEDGLYIPKLISFTYSDPIHIALIQFQCSSIFRNVFLLLEHSHSIQRLVAGWAGRGVIIDKNILFVYFMFQTM